MFEEIEQISTNINEDRVFENLKLVTNYHRFPFTTGLDDSVRAYYDILQKHKIKSHIEQFPATNDNYFWSYQSKPQWKIEKAQLSLLSDSDNFEILADFDKNPMSVIQYSYPFDGVLPIVFIDESASDEEIRNAEIEGKLVLTNGWINEIKKRLIDEAGAKGLVVYDIPPNSTVRKRKELIDAIYQTSFTWTFVPSEISCFGFVLSPREGEILRQKIEERKQQALPPLSVSITIKSRIMDSTFPVLVAEIPGRLEQEIVVVSHICHSQPSANDNGSGNAVALEAAIVINEMVKQGEIPTPRRTIRFLWVPEMAGSYAYLSSHEDDLSKMITGINLDMIGGNECQNGSSLLIESPSDSCPSFSSYLLNRLRQEFLYCDSFSHTGMSPFPLFRASSTAFAGASDHLVFCDPSVGIPMPMLMQFPDKFHHTSEDTLDKIDKKTLRKTSILSLGYLTFLARASDLEAEWIQLEINKEFMNRISRTYIKWVERSLLNQGSSLSEEEFNLQMKYLYNVYRDTVDSLKQIGNFRLNDEEIVILIDSYKEKFKLNYAAEVPYLVIPEGSNKNILNAIPERISRGPAPFFRMTSNWSTEDILSWSYEIAKRHEGGNTLPILAEFWINGVRNCLEISRLVFFETGIWDPNIVCLTLEKLNQNKLIYWK